MKTKLSVLLLNAFLIISSLGGMKAQVTIGHSEAPEKHATLQIKDQTATSTGGVTAKNGGLLLPRVELENKYQLLPFYQGDTTDTDYKTVTKPAHTGLIVYNLKESDEDELCLGFNQWDGGQWNCFQSKMGNAMATLGSCDSLQFEGLYQNEVPLDGGNYMTIALHVSKAGAYTVTATTESDNGYYFTATGVFMATGYYFISIPGAGTPKNHTEDKPTGDKMKITFNGKVMDKCDKYVDVKDSSKKPLYTMDCATAKANGIYTLNKPLDKATNTITLFLDVDITAVGATYVIETDVVDGISFKGSGQLNSVRQEVTLYPADGSVPTTTDDKTLIIKSNSTRSVATCKVKVTTVIPKKKVFVIGDTSAYGYNFTVPGARSNQIVTSTANFGVLPTSTFKAEGFEFVLPNTSHNTTLNATELETVRTQLLTNKVDICVLTHNVYMTQELSNIVVEYLRKGGVVIAYKQHNYDLTPFFKTLFSDEDGAISTGTINGAGAVYQMTTAVNDMITNGPFGDVRGEYWGEDSSVTARASGLPGSAIDVYTAGYDWSNNTANTGTVTGFKHKTLNFVWFGDCGFLSGDGGTSTTACPLKNSGAPDYKPATKTGFGRGTAANRKTVSNAIIFANTLAWALTQAEFNGINTVK
ncbi:hypothetical protein M2451_001874 [Dysgonomonas sp. PFB1-18]|uniref:hypothetical protein n=1 Tax=unclassified Dysgonomonas TaxID=2630389 RepID=UPI002473DB79|nr:MULTISPECIES: hypothetical protein [unclassified Dysgonomonas]MDH6309509.1 hypothetical protein [Dysgonomonas sp. PF1-14]MDH6339163.1 hypothetical protein [Dysgonomonas sp. PF1-16]MDH6380550.1 hypothetical protein [Dysgonomonas sp. PFB1-18]MDH6398046.1 hypothetical protein [Dysgonomonas sp. PF1-23]